MLAENEKILLTVTGAILLVLFLVVVFIISIVRYQRRVTRDIMANQLLKEHYEQEILQSKLETQEQTFQHIARELHDNVGQLLSTSRMLLGLTERNLESPPHTLLHANATLGQAIGELRSLSKSLDKEWLEQFSFYDNLQVEIVRINESGEVLKAAFTGNPSIALAPDRQILLFRIVQEAMQNAIKHARADHLHIQVKEHPTALHVAIIDNGTGFEWNTAAAGMGLRNMQYRTRLLGGSIHWESPAGSGTTVTIQIPY